MFDPGACAAKFVTEHLGDSLAAQPPPAEEEAEGEEAKEHKDKQKKDEPEAKRAKLVDALAAEFAAQQKRHEAELAKLQAQLGGFGPVSASGTVSSSLRSSPYPAGHQG